MSYFFYIFKYITLNLWPPVSLHIFYVYMFRSGAYSNGSQILCIWLCISSADLVLVCHISKINHNVSSCGKICRPKYMTIVPSFVHFYIKIAVCHLVRNNHKIKLSNKKTSTVKINITNQSNDEGIFITVLIVFEIPP